MTELGISRCAVLRQGARLHLHLCLCHVMSRLVFQGCLILQATPSVFHVSLCISCNVFNATPIDPSIHPRIDLSIHASSIASTHHCIYCNYAMWRAGLSNWIIPFPSSMNLYSIMNSMQVLVILFESSRYQRSIPAFFCR